MKIYNRRRDHSTGHIRHKRYQLQITLVFTSGEFKLSCRAIFSLEEPHHSTTEFQAEVPDLCLAERQKFPHTLFWLVCELPSSSAGRLGHTDASPVGLGPESTWPVNHLVGPDTVRVGAEKCPDHAYARQRENLYQVNFILPSRTRIFNRKVNFFHVV